MNESLNRALRAVKAQALREAAEAWGDGHEGFPYQWLHDRADRIEATEGTDWSAATHAFALPYTEQETTK